MTDSRPAISDTLLSVVLPVFNEAEALDALLRGVLDSLTALESAHEVIFVNDGSTDDSAAILDRLAEEHAIVRVIHLSRNFGHQAAVQAGLAHAGGDAVVLMDADMQDSPEAIGRFVAQWRAGYDVVYAIRADRKENCVKRFLFASFHRFMAGVASVPIPPDAGNFGLVDRRVADEIIRMRERDRYFPGLRGWVGFRQKGIRVERNARYDDHPRVSLGGLFRLAKTAIFSFSSFPLTVFQLITALAAVVFVALGGYSLYCKLFTDLTVPGWTAHLLVGSFFGAVNALGICILGEYLARIYDQVRDRPLYIVRRTVNLAEQDKQDAGPNAQQAAGSETRPRPLEELDVRCNELLDQADDLLIDAEIPASGRDG